MYTCPVCNNKIVPSIRGLRWDSCLNNVHPNCTNLSRDEYRKKTKYPLKSCIRCNEKNVPFNAIIYDFEFEVTLLTNDLDYINLEVISDQMFTPFELNDDPLYIPRSGLDPDTNYFSEFSSKVNSQSKHYLADEFQRLDSSQCITAYN